MPGTNSAVSYSLWNRLQSTDKYCVSTVSFIQFFDTVGWVIEKGIQPVKNLCPLSTKSFLEQVELENCWSNSLTQWHLQTAWLCGRVSNLCFNLLGVITVKRLTMQVCDWHSKRCKFPVVCLSLFLTVVILVSLCSDVYICCVLNSNGKVG